MPSDELYLKLAEALSQPSKAYRAAQAGFDIPRQAIEGYKYGAELSDSIRNRRLQRQTLGEALGGMVPEELQDLPVDQARNLVPLALAKAQLDRTSRLEDSADADLKRQLMQARIDSLRNPKPPAPPNPLDDELKRARINALKTSPTSQSTKESAMGRVSGNLKDLRSYYEDLDKMKGIANTTRGGFDNLRASAKSSGVGQAVGQAFGTKEQSIRNSIKMMQPLLIQDIRKASEMGARGLDSEKELAFYLKAATDPSIDLQANLQAIDVLDRAYGLNLKNGGPNGSVNNLDTSENDDPLGLFDDR